MKILLTVNSTWNVYNFRLNLINHLKHEGYNVIIAAPVDEYSLKLSESGNFIHNLPIQSHKINPIIDLLVLLRYMQLYKKYQPDIILSFTAKPNIYGGIVARLFSIPCIPNISGLGTVFIKRNWLTMVVQILYQLALKSSPFVLFQNGEDLKFFVNKKITKIERTIQIPGSGVDTTKFFPKVKSKKKRL